MFTWGSKFFIGLGVAMLAAAVLYAVVTGGGLLGPLTAGWYQGVGDHLGYGVLLGVGLGLVLLGVMTVVTRDANAEDVALAVGTERVPQALPPVNPSFWGAVTGFAVGSLVIGVSVSELFLLVGFVLLVIVAAEWLVLAWSDQATGDPAANRTIRNRLMLPIEVPLFGALAIGVFTLGVSRVFLAVPKMGAVALASILATVIFAAAIAFAYRPGWFSRGVTSGLVAGFAGLVLISGVVAAAVGPRDFEHHGHDPAEHHDEEFDDGAGGAHDRAVDGDEADTEDGS